MSDLLKLLAPLAPKYEFIEICLKVPMNTLGLIYLPEFFPKNLLTTLQWWIENGAKVDLPVTWDNLINAIDCEIIGNYEVVQEVKDFVKQ